MTRKFVAETAGRSRAVTPVVGKVLEVALVVLFVGTMTAGLYGGLVPGYRTAAGAEIGDRTLATAAGGVERAVPPPATAATVTRRVALPRTVRGAPYRLVVEDRTLVLEHPHAGVGGRLRLSLPARVASVRGEWRSQQPAVVTVRTGPGGVAVRLEAGDG